MSIYHWLRPAHIVSALLLASSCVYILMEAITTPALDFSGNAYSAVTALAAALSMVSFVIPAVYAHHGANMKRRGFQELEAVSSRLPAAVTWTHIGPGVVYCGAVYAVAVVAAISHAGQRGWSSVSVYPAVLGWCFVTVLIVGGYVVGRAFPSRFTPLATAACCLLLVLAAPGVPRLLNLHVPMGSSTLAVWETRPASVMWAAPVLYVCVVAIGLLAVRPGAEFAALVRWRGWRRRSLAALAAGAVVSSAVVLGTPWKPELRFTQAPYCVDRSEFSACVWPEHAADVDALMPGLVKLAAATHGTPAQFERIGEPGVPGSFDVVLASGLGSASPVVDEVMGIGGDPFERCSADPEWSQAWGAAVSAMAVQLFPSDVVDPSIRQYGAEVAPEPLDVPAWQQVIREGLACETPTAFARDAS